MERVIGRNNNTEAEQKFGVYRVASFDAGFVCDDAAGAGLNDIRERTFVEAKVADLNVA